MKNIYCIFDKRRDDALSTNLISGEKTYFFTDVQPFRLRFSSNAPEYGFHASSHENTVSFSFLSKPGFMDEWYYQDVVLSIDNNKL